jgi:hypothetical protein
MEKTNSIVTKSRVQTDDYLRAAERARRQTLLHQQAKLKESMEICTHWVHFWLHFQNREKVPIYGFVMECWSDAVTGRINAIHGFYKDAYRALRSTLELTLSGILFESNSEALEKYLDTDKTPRWQKLKDVLDLQPFQNYREHFQDRRMVGLAGLLDKDAVNDYYQEVLSSRVHSHIGTWDSLDRLDVVPYYLETKFNSWHKNYVFLNKICFLCLVTYFPDVLSLIKNSLEPEDIASILTPAQRRYFKV